MNSYQHCLKQFFADKKSETSRTGPFYSTRNKVGTALDFGKHLEVLCCHFSQIINSFGVKRMVIGVKNTTKERCKLLSYYNIYTFYQLESNE